MVHTPGIRMRGTAWRAGTPHLSATGHHTSTLPRLAQTCCSHACSCSELVRVAFHINALTAIPATFGRLTKLEAATWHRNRIAALPDTIGGLTRLREFALFENRLRTLPEAVSGLKRCTEFWLYDNCLEALPDGIAGMTALRCAPHTLSAVCRLLYSLRLVAAARTSGTQ